MANSFKRLPSFKSPRDLNLSKISNNISEARTKKVFVPNLNVQRKKPNEGEVEKTEERDGDKGRQKRSNIRERVKKEYIQTSGVFSEGLAAPLKKAATTGGGGGTLATPRGGGGTVAAKGGGGGGGPLAARGGAQRSLTMWKGVKSHKEDEDLILKELLRDDFLEDGQQPDPHHCPIQLPLSKLEKLKLELKCDEKFSDDLPLKKIITNLEVKSEPKDDEALDESGRLGITAPSEFTFLQVPNIMPPSKLSDSVLTSGKDQRQLRDLPEGRIGTLQILSSGKARILLSEDCWLYLEPATDLPFKQELVSVKTDQNDKAGEIISLGEISSRFLLTPNWGSLVLASHSNV